jgi:hypothetical protein
LNQFGEALQIEGVRNPYINMTADLFDHAFFIITLKNTLLIILAALAIVFLTLIGDALTIKPQKIPETAGEFSDTHFDNKMSVNFDDDSIDFDIPPMDEEIHAEEEEESFADIDFNIPSEDLSSHIPEDNHHDEDNHNDEKICDGPQGLYSPHGNISWEAYTKDRLASELHRCASYEQDMVFIIMEFRGNKQKDDAFFNEFADMAVSFFGHRDMVFEWKEDGVSIIVPNIDLDQGVAKCEDFHNRVKTKLLHSSSLEWELCMGLSSRAGRLIDPDRLLFETAQAVSRAMVDPVSPIIAFKSDPERYRAFIAGQHSEE